MRSLIATATKPRCTPSGRADLLLLLEDGGTGGAAIWRAILIAIKELDPEREPDEAVN